MYVCLFVCRWFSKYLMTSFLSLIGGNSSFSKYEARPVARKSKWKPIPGSFKMVLIRLLNFHNKHAPVDIIAWIQSTPLPKWDRKMIPRNVSPRAKKLFGRKKNRKKSISELRHTQIMDHRTHSLSTCQQNELVCVHGWKRSGATEKANVCWTQIVSFKDAIKTNSGVNRAVSDDTTLENRAKKQSQLARRSSRHENLLFLLQAFLITDNGRAQPGLVAMQAIVGQRSETSSYSRANYERCA